LKVEKIGQKIREVELFYSFLAPTTTYKISLSHNLCGNHEENENATYNDNRKSPEKTK